MAPSDENVISCDVNADSLYRKQRPLHFRIAMVEADSGPSPPLSVCCSEVSLDQLDQLRHELYYFTCNRGKNEMPVTLSFCFLLFEFIFTPTPVKGHYQVTSLSQPVVAAPGDDVVLQCLVEPQLDMVDMTVEWSRPDAKHRPKGMEYVHLYRDNHEVLDMKSLLYHNRTALSLDGLRRGNISLIVTNVTTADGGEYKCFIPKLHGNSKSSIVRLIVDPNSSKTITSGTQLYPEEKRQNVLNGGVSCSSSFIPLIVIWVLLIFSA